MNCFKQKAVIGLVLLSFLGCTSSSRFAGRGGHVKETRTRPVGKNSNTQETSTQQRTEQPGKIATGKILLTLEGVISYYAHDFNGKQTSNGETFDMHDLTAAHRTFPFGTRVRVTNLENNKSVIVRVNDRGPFWEGRIMDVSFGAAKEIDLILNGTARARLEVLEWGNGQ
jgi:rare lipoprotein A